MHHENSILSIPFDTVCGVIGGGFTGMILSVKRDRDRYYRRPYISLKTKN